MTAKSSVSLAKKDKNDGFGENGLGIISIFKDYDKKNRWFSFLAKKTFIK